jgi:hypothetical protein
VEYIIKIKSWDPLDIDVENIGCVAEPGETVFIVFPSFEVELGPDNSIRETPPLVSHVVEQEIPLAMVAANVSMYSNVLRTKWEQYKEDVQAGADDVTLRIG